MPSFSEMIALFSNSKYAQEDESISELMIPLILEQIDMHPDWPDLFNSLGLQFLFNKKMLEAESAFLRAVELNPEYVAARINLMKTLKKMGKYEKSYDCGKVLLSKNLPYPDVYYSLSEILMSLDRFEEALNHANKVLELRPEMKNAHLLIAQIYQKSGQNDLAKKEIKKCLSFAISPQLAIEAQKKLQELSGKSEP